MRRDENNRSIIPKTEWQWIHGRIYVPSLLLTLDHHILKRTVLFKYLEYYIDEKLSFNQHCNKMIETIQKNSSLLKDIARSQTSSIKARQFIFNAFILPNLQLIYTVWLFLFRTTRDKVESRNRQLYRIVHNWWDATNDQVRLFPDFQTMETRAQRFLRRFIDKVLVEARELFDDYILIKAMHM